MKTFGLIVPSLYFPSTGAAEMRDRLKRKKELATTGKCILLYIYDTLF
jgi:hypothetical protein